MNNDYIMFPNKTLDTVALIVLGYVLHWIWSL